SQKIEQNSEALNIQEGKTATLTCNYTNYTPSYLQWYRQDPGRGPVFLLLIRENEKEKWKERLKVTFDTTLKQSLFHITASQPADSATYLCALDTQ
uniref:T cell receptor alpha variable 6 n=1 Tax=Piliocolobus tephrosceles TaxID=591936 RepID=A0A8C9HTJ5_9PRIM